MEGLLRRAIWLFRERPAVAWGSTGALAVVLGALGVAGLRRLVNRAKARPLLRLPAAEAASLRALIARAETDAQRSGALVPLGGGSTRVLLKSASSGVTFVFTLLSKSASDAKDKTSSPTEKAAAPQWPPRDAFQLPLGPTHVASIAVVDSSASPAAAAAAEPTHELLLNKFPVMPGHLVLSTTRFLPQSSPLELRDMQALWSLVHPSRGLGALGFFNGGFNSGASQPRRHMQLVPFDRLRAALPEELLPQLPADAVPLDIAIAGVRAGLGWQGPHPHQPFTVPGWSFPHAVALLGKDDVTADPLVGGERIYALYLSLLQQLVPAAAAAAAPGAPAKSTGAQAPGHGAAATRAAAAAGDEAALYRSIPRPEEDKASHNLLLTPRWMLVVPRVTECWLGTAATASQAAGGASRGVSVNSLGFAGLLLSRMEQHLQAVKTVGPDAVLKAVVTGEQA